jgi:hypothetical protein
MEVSHFRERLTDIVDSHAGGEELDFAHWLALKKEIDHLLADAGSDARCPHPQPLYTNKLCLFCGRRPTARNTLPPKDAA